MTASTTRGAMVLEYSDTTYKGRVRRVEERINLCTIKRIPRGNTIAKPQTVIYLGVEGSTGCL
jgi:hypothetical protein